MKKIFSNQNLNERVDCIKENLINEFNPEKIILFGSYAREKDKVEEDISEIDILVIAKVHIRFTERIKRARKICKGEPPINPLIYTPRELEKLLEDGEGFIEEAVDEGIILYEKEDE